jgi:hypothetical protein
MKPYCQTLRTWLKANLGPHCLAPLTGTDARLLDAAVHLVDAYSVNLTNPVAHAFGDTVRLMQPHCRELAYHAIAHVMDWSHRAHLWAQAELEPLPTLRRCAAEPACPAFHQPSTIHSPGPVPSATPGYSP